MGLSRAVRVALLVLAAVIAGQGATTAAARPSHAYQEGSAARSGHALLAETFMEPLTGGSLSTSAGVAINVPGGVMKRAGYVKIFELARGVYYLHIYAPWQGSVTVTVPIRGPSDRVVHKVAGIWVNESQAPGQATVTVTRLSSFISALGKVVNKVAGKLCLTTNLTHLIECAAGHIDSKLKSWIESKLPHNCAAQLAEAGTVPAMLKAAVSGDCVGHAAAPPYHVPTTAPSQTPSSGSSTPAQPSPTPVPPSGESPPTPQPQPLPPPESKSIQIGWSGTHPGWIWMTLGGFSPGPHQYTCSFASGGDKTFTLTETASPQTWDNGHTCYDYEHGDTVWVVIEGISSNAVRVP
jgi:hypothetical protein